MYRDQGISVATAAPPIDTTIHTGGSGTVEAGEAVRRRWVLLLASLISFMIALDALVVTTALSEIGRAHV